MAWFDTGEAMGALNAIGRDANNFIKRTIEEIEKDLSRVEVNVGAPGLRFGQSRNSSSAGTSEGGPMGSETKGPVKKAMACEGCSTKFSFMKRKRECLECRRLYCTQCLPKALPVSGSGSGGWCSRERRQTTCSKCLVLLAQPPSRSALLGLRTRDLQAFLASRKVPTHGCLEKDDLVNLVVQLSNYDANDPRARSPRSHGLQSPLSDQFPQSAEADRRCRGDLPSPRSEAGGDGTPAVHSFGSRTEVHYHQPPSSPPSSESSSLPTSPSRMPPRDHLYSRFPSEDNGRGTAEDATQVPPTAGQVSPGGTKPRRPDQPAPPFGGAVSEDSDWVMVDVEEHVLPPYGAGSTQAPSVPPPRDTTTPPPAPSAEPLTTTSRPSSPQAQEDLPPPAESGASSDDGGPVSPAEGVDTSRPRVEDLGATTAPSSSTLGSTPEMSVSGGTNHPSEMEDVAQASSASQSPSLNRTSASLSQGSSPSKSGAFLTPRDIASSILSSTTSEEDLSSLSVKQLKELLTSSRVDYRGCCEKKELLERAQRLWREYKASHENLSDDTMCKVCMDANIDCVMLECGHMATCTPCGKRMSECPICRQYVVRIVRTFRA